MVKIRLHGTQEEVLKAEEYLKNNKAVEVLSTSDCYNDRNNKYIRKYLDIKLNDEQLNNHIDISTINGMLADCIIDNTVDIYDDKILKLLEKIASDFNDKLATQIK